MEKDKIWLNTEIRKTYLRIKEESTLYKQLKSKYLGKMERLFATAYQLTLNQDKQLKKDLKKEYTDLYKSCGSTFTDMGGCFTRLKCARDYLYTLKKELHAQNENIDFERRLA